MPVWYALSISYHSLLHSQLYQFDMTCMIVRLTLSICYDISAYRQPAKWSSCTKERLERDFERNRDHCLKNKPEVLEKVGNTPICGNLFVEDGKQLYDYQISFLLQSHVDHSFSSWKAQDWRSSKNVHPFRLWFAIGSYLKRCIVIGHTSSLAKDLCTRKKFNLRFYITLLSMIWSW